MSAPSVNFEEFATDAQRTALKSLESNKRHLLPGSLSWAQSSADEDLVGSFGWVVVHNDLIHRCTLYADGVLYVERESDSGFTSIRI